MIVQLPALTLWITAALLGAAGFAVGTAYFASLRRGVRLSVARGAWSWFALSAPARMVPAALFFILAARWGGPALLMAFAGFLTARHLAVRAARRPA
jgi:F1F0 ATPase subunit 2